MSTRLLSQEYVKELQEHIYVKIAIQRVVTFTSEFKQLAYDELHRGKTMRQIFEEAGVDTEKPGQMRLMKKHSLKCPIRKANPYRRMAKALKTNKVFPNILNRQFKAYSHRKVRV